MDNLGYTMIKIAWLEIVPKLFKMILVISAENPEAFFGREIVDFARTCKFLNLRQGQSTYWDKKVDDEIKDKDKVLAYESIRRGNKDRRPWKPKTSMS